MPVKPGWIAFTVIFMAILGWSVYRDIQIEQQYTADLRNRIVGARLEKEHASPYFYTWQQGDPIRYYDPSNISQPANPLHVSNITATPFFHRLMAPLANLPQRTISRAWLLIEYVMLALCVGIALALAGNRTQKAMVLAAAALFLLTEAWKDHIACGQYYLLIPLLALLFYFFSRDTRRVWFGAAAGLCAILLVLIRPNCLVLLLPFLLLVKKYPVRWLVAFFLPVVMLAGLEVVNPQERALWMDYKNFLGEQIKIHQGSGGDAAPPQPVYANWEGWRQSDIDASYARFPYDKHSEHGNIFVLFEKIVHRKTNVAVLSTALVIVLLALLVVFIRKRRLEADYDPLPVAVFGFCLYMISDLFSPVWRFQYYTLQWLCPVLLVAAAYKPGQQKWFILLGFMLALNILNIPFIKMEHTLGEYGMLAVLLLLAIAPPRHPFLPDAPPQMLLNNRDRSNR